MQSSSAKLIRIRCSSCKVELGTYMNGDLRFRSSTRILRTCITQAAAGTRWIHQLRCRCGTETRYELILDFQTELAIYST